jgi:hypothetical protein
MKRTIGVKNESIPLTEEQLQHAHTSLNGGTDGLRQIIYYDDGTIEVNDHFNKLNRV